MAITGGYTVTPHHRQNRRRERPGSRTRRTITRKTSVQYDCAEGLLDARDNSVPLPSDKARPSPLLRQNLDQSWQRWKARQAEEKAIAVMDNMQLEQEQQRLFGGDFGDDDVSLIPAMLGVLERLFDGDLDYIDPILSHHIISCFSSLLGVGGVWKADECLRIFARSSIAWAFSTMMRTIYKIPSYT